MNGWSMGDVTVTKTPQNEFLLIMFGLTIMLQINTTDMG